MILLRIFCAAMTAWAFNWALGRPVAEPLIGEYPRLAVYGPIGAALVGFFILGKRAGNGLAVGVANGIWTAFVSIIAAIVLYLAGYMAVNMVVIDSFEDFLRILADEAAPLLSAWARPLLVGLVVAGGAVAGLVTEILHWALTKAREARGEDEEEEIT